MRPDRLAIPQENADSITPQQRAGLAAQRVEALLEWGVQIEDTRRSHDAMKQLRRGRVARRFHVRTLFDLFGGKEVLWRVTFFKYEYASKAKPLLRAFGVRPDRDGVRVENDRFTATFGFLNLDVPLVNIVSAEATGPYRWYTALGARLSFADHGLTFGTTAEQGVCVQFDDPISPVIGPWKHPGLTVTVADTAGLVALLESHRP